MYVKRVNYNYRIKMRNYRLTSTFATGRKYAMLKLKILLSTIMRNYRVYSDLSESDFRLQADIILKREEGFRVRLQPRQPGQATTTGSTAAS